MLSDRRTGREEPVTGYPGGISEGYRRFPPWIWVVIVLVAAFAWLVAPFSLFNP